MLEMMRVESVCPGPVPLVWWNECLLGRSVRSHTNREHGGLGVGVGEEREMEGWRGLTERPTPCDEPPLKPDEVANCRGPGSLNKRERDESGVREGFCRVENTEGWGQIGREGGETRRRRRRTERPTPCTGPPLKPDEVASCRRPGPLNKRERDEGTGAGAGGGGRPC